MKNHQSMDTREAESTGAMADAADEQERGLTRRQRRVLQWLAQGKDVTDVAERLDRDPEQLALRVQELLARLGVSTAQEALDLPDLPESDEDAEPRHRLGRKRREEADAG